MQKEYKWKVHFFKQKPVRGWLILLLYIILLSYFIFFEKSVLFTILAVILVIYPSLKFYIPITFKIDENGVVVSNSIRNKKYNWDYFKRVKKDSSNIVLDPYEEKRYFRRKKKVILFNVPQNKDILNFIKKRVKQ
ncbi:MAG TPA: hypothetical protein VKN74_03405 [Candidatus Mcinerneyibacterium sp.]|nr:hypothetical protein [Candidatus Mcinerneyibacterium sp.]